MSVYYFKSDVDLNCMNFHPESNLLVTGSINGQIDLYKFENFDNGLVKNWTNTTTHSSSVRISKFSENGKDVMSASSDKKLALTELETNKIKWVGKGHKNPVNTAIYINENVLASGDDEGEIRIWDVRTKGGTVGVINEFEDCVTDLVVKNNELLVTCGDQVGCFDYKKCKLKALSDNLEHEFLTMALVKDNKKLVCGTATGSVCLFSYGFWGDFNDLIPVNKETINSLVKVNEDVVCACGDDGDVYLIQILPNKVLGKLREFKNFDVNVKSTDSLTINHDKTLLGFLVNFEYICLVDTQEMNKLLDNVKSDFFDDI